MEEIKNTPASNNEKDKKNRMLILLLLLLCAGSLIFNVILYNKKGEMTVMYEKAEASSNSFRDSLLLLQDEYSKLETEDEAVKAELEEKKARIAELLEEAEKHKDDAYIIAKLRKETQTLRKIMMGFVQTIDSLNQVNQTLTAEKEEVTQNLNQEKQRTSNLTAEKEQLQSTVKKGSILIAHNVRAAGINLKSGGKKEVETTKAKKTEQVKVSFILGENKIAQSGDKDVFLRMLTPDGKELSTGTGDANRFSFNGVNGYFCAKQTVSYKNEEVNMSLYAKNASGFMPGRYIIEVYCDEALIGQTTLTLN